MRTSSWYCLLIILCLLLFGCRQDEDLVQQGGWLHLSLEGVSATTPTTKSTPAQLGKPQASQFTLSIRSVNSQKELYNAPYSEQVIPLRVGEYTVKASCGTNVYLGLDAPYYEGETKAHIRLDETTHITLPCKVGNALISVRFGRNEEERARFDKHYANYGINVLRGTQSVNISADKAHQSAYFSVGEAPILKFYGEWKAGGNKKISYTLSAANLPLEFQKAEHAIITLGLPEPESATRVEITKIELQQMSLQETIPLSWLPVAKVIASHEYNEQGNLVGTKLDVSDAFPGNQWKAVIKNASNDEVRMLLGNGNLSSLAESSAEWPYLPSGTYEAFFYLVEAEKETFINSRTFEIGKPNLQLQLGGYSAHTKYMQNQVEDANACNPLTVYAPSMQINVDQTLLTHPRYSYEFTAQFDESAIEIPRGINSYTTQDRELLAIRFEPHILSASFTFDQTQVTATREFLITGLPVDFTPPSEANGWQTQAGTVSFSADNVKLGQMGAAGESSILNSHFAIPVGTNVALDYRAMIHPATMGTTLSFTLGNDILAERKEDGGLANSTDYPFEGTTTLRLTSNASNMTCVNSYSSGQTRSHVYSLSLKYASNE